jgi:hypothetical protein
VDARGAWWGVVALNAVLGVAAAVPLFLWLVVVADLAWGVDPTLVDDGLAVWVHLGVLVTALYSGIALPLNLALTRRAGLRGRPWWLVAVLVTVAVGLLVLRVVMPDLWHPYADR